MKVEIDLDDLCYLIDLVEERHEMGDTSRYEGGAEMMARVTKIAGLSSAKSWQEYADEVIKEKEEWKKQS